MENWRERDELLISPAARLISHKYNTNNPEELNTYGLGSKMENWKRDLWNINLVQANGMQTIINCN